MKSDDEEIDPIIEFDPDPEQLTRTPCCKERERLEIERKTQEFLRRKGKVVELAPSTERADSLLF